MGKLTHRTHATCTYFVTTKTWENHHIFQVVESAEILLGKLMGYRDLGAYQCMSSS